MKPAERLRTLADQLCVDDLLTVRLVVARRFHADHVTVAHQLGPDLRAVLEELDELRAEREGGDRG